MPRFIRNSSVLTMVLLLTAGGLGKALAQEQQTIFGKKVVMIIATQGFHDEELLVPKQLFEEQGIEVTIASSHLEEAQGESGARITPNILLDNVQAEDYDAVIFVGGMGAMEYWEESKAHALIRSALDAGKFVCAMCIAPVTLANAGILVGRQVTVAAFGALVEAKGATNTEGQVETDGNIITAHCYLYGPDTAETFAQVTLEALRGQEGPTLVLPSSWSQVKALPLE